MIEKADNVLVKTVKGDAIKLAEALLSFCPSNLQTEKMRSAKEIEQTIPLVNLDEWEKYIMLPA